MASCSTESAQAFVPQTDYSRCAVALWLLQFSLAALILLISGLVFYVKCVGVLAVLLLSFLDRPQRTRVIVVTGSGSWMLPDNGLSDLRILAGTRYTRYWAVIHLGQESARRQTLCVWSDTLSPRDWRQLLIRLREH